MHQLFIVDRNAGTVTAVVNGVAMQDVLDISSVTGSAAMPQRGKCCTIDCTIDCTTVWHYIHKIIHDIYNESIIPFYATRYYDRLHSWLGNRRSN